MANLNPGIGIDSKVRPVVDPTANVIALVEANVKSASMLREADIKFNDKVAEHMRELGALRSEHANETRAYDSDRYDKIRSVDMANAAATAQQILQAVNTNANNQERTAQTLRDQVASTAAAAENRQASFASEIMKRLSAVELSMSEGKGKQTVVDPQMERLSNLVESLARSRSTDTGNSQGAGDTIKWIALAITMIVGLIAINSYMSRQQNIAALAPQVIYVPAPPNTMLPSTPPGTIPR